MSRGSLVLAALLGVALSHVAARADNALRPEQIPAKAKELANRGRAYHDAGDYPAAVAAFKEAYVLAPSPGLLFNIAQAYRLAGNCDDAAWMYRRYLDTNPIGPNRQLAEQHLSIVEKCGTGGLRMSVIPPKVIANVPESHDSSMGAKPMLKDSDLVDGSDADRSRKYKHVALGVTVGAGAALVAATVFALDAHDAQTTVENTYKHGGKWDDVKDTDARGKRSAQYAEVLGIGGGIALASGVVLYGLGHHYEKAQRVAVTPTAHGAQVSLSWGF